MGKWEAYFAFHFPIPCFGFCLPRLRCWRSVAERRVWRMVSQSASTFATESMPWRNVHKEDQVFLLSAPLDRITCQLRVLNSCCPWRMSSPPDSNGIVPNSMPRLNCAPPWVGLPRVPLRPFPYSRFAVCSAGIRCEVNFQSAIPPSISNAVPVTKAASSETR